jgi:YcxB-like protein
MIFKFLIEQSHFAALKLYEASKIKDGSSKKKKIKPIFIIPILILLVIMFGVLGIIGGIMMLIEFLIFFAFLYFVFKKYKENLVKNNPFELRVSKLNKNTKFETTVTINKEFINIENKGGNGKLEIKELKKIIELESFFIIYLHIGYEILIPKTCIQNLDECRLEFEELSSTNNFKYEKDLDWKFNNSF